MYNYDLSCLSFNCGKLGHLQTLKRFYVVAGDRMEIEIDAVFRLTAMRQFITRDVKVDLLCFFVPHRHVYGQQWTDFIQKGVDEQVTFSPAANAVEKIHYTGSGAGLQGSGIPLHIVSGYNKIWNRYFKNPTDENLTKVENQPLQGDDERLYGARCARLPHIWTSGIDSNMPANGSQVPINGGVLDLVDFAQVQGEYKTRLQRDWFDRFYHDVLSDVWGGTTTMDADERPELCYRHSAWLSGYDVDGTDAAALGDYSGKSFGRVNVRMPRKYFGEHGALWCMALLRYPVVHENENHYLDLIANPSYAQIAGDPDIVGNLKPITHEAKDFFDAGGSGQIGEFPYGQWYRSENSVASQVLAFQGAFPFLERIPTDRTTARYEDFGEYDHVFKSDLYGNWTVQAAFYNDCIRNVPGPKSSVFAGAS